MGGGRGASARWRLGTNPPLCYYYGSCRTGASAYSTAEAAASRDDAAERPSLSASVSRRPKPTTRASSSFGRPGAIRMYLGGGGWGGDGDVGDVTLYEDTLHHSTTLMYRPIARGAESTNKMASDNAATPAMSCVRSHLCRVRIMRMEGTNGGCE